MHSEGFKEKYRVAEKAFKRVRVFTFGILLMLMIQKSAKSMQLVLNEFCQKLKLPLVTSSAYSQARKKVSYEAFIELNEKAIVEVMYGDESYERWKGHRLLGIDGSKVSLPNEPGILAEFGGWAVNQHSEKLEPVALVSVMYDLLNEIAVDSQIAQGKRDEVELAMAHLKRTQAGDVLIFDRNYPGYIWLGTLLSRDLHFVGRCSRGSFQAVRDMFQGQGADSQVVTLKVPTKHRGTVRQLGLPEKITVRLIRLTLDSGETEVLITSLLDENRYPTLEFGPLYFKRWGSETFYDLIKNRLLLENFTGRTVEAVKQDFFATIYISGLETLLTQEANDQLQDKSAHNQFTQKVNQAVSFNAIKNHVIELLFTETDTDRLFAQLTQLFKMKPTAIRPNRSVPRPKPSAHRSLRFHKRSKKVSF